jgi:DNA/RNA-binding domain of Phe-tRNA-synthetase-like protein
MLSISGSEAWRSAHPGAIIGLLELSEVVNTLPSPALDQAKRETETRLRERYAGFTRPDFLGLPVMAAYERYYRRFDKTYHVLLQLESIVLKGKSLPAVMPLVDANFTAEVETLVLTAGHDVPRLEGEILMDVSRPGERMLQMNGTDKAILAGDMVMRDAGGICCSILYGQDNRSPISAATSSVLYVAYAPAGVGGEAVRMQLQQIEVNVRLFAPLAKVEQVRLIEA